MRVLLVEDEPTILEFLQAYFAGRGHVVDTASTAPEALARMAANLPDLALVDLKLPKGSGRDVIQGLAAQRARHPTRIIVVTGCDDLELRRDLMAAGVSDYLFKPVLIKELDALFEASAPAADERSTAPPPSRVPRADWRGPLLGWMLVGIATAWLGRAFALGREAPWIMADEVAAVLEAHQPVLLVDARGPEVYAQGHLPGAINIPSERVEQLGAWLPASSILIVYCGGPTCPASTVVAQWLVTHDWPHVLHYAQGFAAWQLAGYPVEVGAPAPAAPGAACCGNAPSSGFGLSGGGTG